MKKYPAISIVSPNGENIARGIKTIEVRSWKPTIDLNTDLVIVENEIFLRGHGQTDPNARAVAIVKIRNIREFTEDDIQAACASYWQEGYYSWELYDIRPLSAKPKVMAKRGIYEVSI
ncbi:ASCH domain-containing protein [Halobacteriovorax marinus]|uniref:ASCH domain-containing protein n=1 Tax=Halobacteriovorax marinus TaxID=97084 RepID=UPI003A8FC033